MISRVLNNLKKCFHLTILPFRFSKYLKRGLYKYNTSTTILFHRTEKGIDNEWPMVFGSIDSNGNIFRRVFSKLFIFLNTSSNKLFYGDYMVISSSETEYKFFDHTDNRILTYYSDTSKLKFVYENRLEWSRWINTVDCCADIENHTLTERMITTVHFSSARAFEQILYDYSKYLEGYKKSVNSFYSIEENHLELFCNLWNDKSLYKKLIAFTKETPIPLFKTHGDLWRSNVLYDGKQFFYIDFEQTAQRIYFYDIFMYILSDAFILKDNMLLEKFVLGDFDNYLMTVSKHVNYNYNVSKKYLYLSLFVFEWFNNRWYGTPDEKLVSEVSKIVMKYCKEI